MGFTTSQAALLLSAGGALALLGRLGSGFAADRRSGRHLPVIMIHLVIGAAGIALISFDQGMLVLVGTLVAFGIGWSWPGVMIFALVRLGRDSPGSASSAVQGGNFAGAALGPVLFGYLVSTTDYAVAWRVSAATMLVAAGLVLLARRIFVADRRRRPPVRAFH